MAFLEDNCILDILSDGILEECHPFVCGDDDMDEFFHKDALDYTRYRMGKVRGIIEGLPFTLNKSIIFADYLERSDFMITFAEKRWRMTFLNQFHKEATERKLRKIAESLKSPMNSIDAANYMKRNFEMAKQMEASSK